MVESAESFIKRKKAQPLGEFSTKDITRLGNAKWRREAQTFRVQSNYPQKVFMIERLRLVGLEGEIARTNTQLGEVEYRFGYYIVSRRGQRSGRWWWGQYCPFIPTEDFWPLIEQARAEGTLLGP